MNNSKIERCIICEKAYIKNIKPKRPRRIALQSNPRSVYSVTCSKGCSKLYETISKRIISPYREEIIRLKKDIKKLKEMLGEEKGK